MHQTPFRMLLIIFLTSLAIGFSMNRENSFNFANSLDAPPRKVDFVKQVQPVLKASCIRCHGPAVQMGQLRLDSKQLVTQGGISGNALVPGKSAESLLVQRIQGLGEKVRMPLDSEPLKDEQIQLIRDWIDQGALWPEEASVADAKISTHWAYLKPVRPNLPSLKNPSWVKNPIDSFVLDRLEKEGLHPSPEAAKEVLLRRVTLDLTGLPPTIREIEAFLEDSSKDAYSKVVDRLLASPHYGERWARPWLDLARYADTNGYEKDTRRTMWTYRDWVIQALNRDMPFSQFTIEQIAGDLLPGATPEQKIATGFHRNTMTNEEDGVDKEEARWMQIVDRVNTTATVWLGSTLGCAQCHNHKYDPFTQKDYYRIFAFFENSEYRLDGVGTSHVKLVEPILELPDPEKEARRKALTEEIAQTEEKLNRQTGELNAALELWEKQESPKQAAWHILEPAQFTFSGSAYFWPAENKSLRVATWSEKVNYTLVIPTSLRGITAFQLEVLPDPSLPALGPGLHRDGNFVLTSFNAEIAEKGKPNAPIPLINAQADFSQPNFPISNVLDDNPETGWSIAPQTGKAHTAIIRTASPLEIPAGASLVLTLEHQYPSDFAAIGRFRLSASIAPGVPSAQALPDEIRTILAVTREYRSPVEKKQLETYYRSISPLLQAERERLAQMRKTLQEIQPITALVLQEKSSTENPSTFLRIKGAYLSKGERVEAGVPASLHPLAGNVLPNRLALARWLVDEENPLVARVTVNRLWEQLFGRGIVETTEDFGTKGEKPSHPELLDWLATDFVRQGWSLKAILRVIVTSATYQQSSRIPPEWLERDPYNKLLARGPRFRLEAEMIRDTALAASGLLSAKMGGPSVFPYQPEGIWSLPYNPDKWVNDEGEDRYRRGIYTFWRRTVPYPSFISYDATSREFCTVRRIRTSTPLQALTSLNDPAFFEAAQAMAQRLIKDGGPDTQSRIRYGYQLCTARKPDPSRPRRPHGSLPARVESLQPGSSSRRSGDWSQARRAGTHRTFAVGRTDGYLKCVIQYGPDVNKRLVPRKCEGCFKPVLECVAIGVETHEKNEHLSSGNHKATLFPEHGIQHWRHRVVLPLEYQSAG